MPPNPQKQLLEVETPGKIWWQLKKKTKTASWRRRLRWWKSELQCSNYSVICECVNPKKRRNVCEPE